MINVNKNIILFYLGINFHMSIKHSLRLASTISSVLKTYSTLLWQSCKYQTNYFLLSIKFYQFCPFYCLVHCSFSNTLWSDCCLHCPEMLLLSSLIIFFCSKSCSLLTLFFISLERLASLIYVPEPFSLLSLY